MKKIAIIDLGSNSIRMSIFLKALPIQILGNYRSTIRLSEGMTQDNILRPDAQMRAIKAILEYKKIIEEQGVEDTFLVATAAVRKAKNQHEFLTLVKDMTDFDIKVINGKTEALLDGLAVSRTLDCAEGIICDIGGGSTELIGISSCDTLMSSIPHGCRGICEKFFRDGETATAIAESGLFFDRLLSKEGWLSEFQGQPLIGTGGTLRALAKFALSDEDKTTIKSYETTPEHLERIMTEIAKADITTRHQMVGIGAERADIIMGGIVILSSIIKHLAPSKILVTDVGVREGVFFDAMETLEILKNFE